MVAHARAKNWSKVLYLLENSAIIGRERISLNIYVYTRTNMLAFSLPCSKCAAIGVSRRRWASKMARQGSRGYVHAPFPRKRVMLWWQLFCPYAKRSDANNFFLFSFLCAGHLLPPLPKRSSAPYTFHVTMLRWHVCLYSLFIES
jgi:hypothetical protein